MSINSDSVEVRLVNGVPCVKNRPITLDDRQLGFLKGMSKENKMFLLVTSVIYK